MAERTWYADANRGIIGLGPAPWGRAYALEWPTEGYDGPLHAQDWEAAEERPADPFALSGHTREEWLALGDLMIARWTAWRVHIAGLTPSTEAPHG